MRDVSSGAHATVSQSCCVPCSDDGTASTTRSESSCEASSAAVRRTRRRRERKPRVLAPTVVSVDAASASDAQIALFAVFTLKITANILMHFLVRGELGAGIVILCRLTCVCLSSCALLGFFIFTE